MAALSSGLRRSAMSAAAAAGHVERASDFVKGVTDLVAPIHGVDGIIVVAWTRAGDEHDPGLVQGVEEVVEPARREGEERAEEQDAPVVHGHFIAPKDGRERVGVVLLAFERCKEQVPAPPDAITGMETRSAIARVSSKS